jgi:hypothetical protein
LARTRAEVPVRSAAVRATIANGVSWWISRIVSPPPRPSRGCWVRVRSSTAGGAAASPVTPSIASGSMTIVAAMAVKRIGAGRRDSTD